MKNTFLQKIVLFSILIVLANGLIGYVIYQNLLKNNNDRQSSEISQRVIKYSNLILSHIKEIETSSHRYVITQDSVFLRPLDVAKSIVITSLNEVKLLTRNNPNQRRKVDSLRSNIYKRLDISSHLIDLRNKEGLIGAQHYVSSGIGMHSTEVINKIINSINEEEGIRLNQIKTATEHDNSLNSRFAVILFLLMSFFSIILLIAAHNYLKQKKIKMLNFEKLIIANKELNFLNEKLQKNSEELFFANAKLSDQNHELEIRKKELLIANQELITTKASLGDYTKGLQKIIVMTSHKVRRPIANLIGLANILDDNSNSPVEQEQIITYIKESIIQVEIFTRELTEYMIDLNQNKEKIL